MLRVGGRFIVTCRARDGRVAWEAAADNLVVNVGLQHLLDALFAGAAQVNPWYLGLAGGTPVVAAGDTAASHPGWTEVVAYSGATRPEYVDVRSGALVSNSASRALFDVSVDGTTIGGAFLASSSVKGGAAGTLLCAAAFQAGNKVANSGEVLSVRYDFSAADDGV